VTIRILNIGLDRDLLDQSPLNEALQRQLFYVRSIPARICHVVKAPFACQSGKYSMDQGALDVIPCPVRHWSMFAPSAIKVGSQLCNERQFDLIQAQEPFVSGVAAAVLARRFNLPLIVGAFSDEVDNPDWLAERFLNRIANRVGKCVLRNATFIRADSMAVTERLQKAGFSQVQFVPFLITNASRLAEQDARATLIRQRIFAERQGPLVVTVCRLEPEKNISLLIEAMSAVRKCIPHVVLAVVGDGSQRVKLMAEAEQRVPGAIHWFGKIPNTDIGAYYQAANLFVLTSNKESSARVLTESLLAGTPVLTTATAGACEVIDDRQSGRIVPINDLKALVQALTELLTDTSALPAMGAFGREKMLAKVSADAVSNQLRDLYAATLAQPRL
jgi:1,2-diacylglycerol 3-alpha-glucosyltransferase